jgi:hypothetical protein
MTSASQPVTHYPSDVAISSCAEGASVGVNGFIIDQCEEPIHGALIEVLQAGEVVGHAMTDDTGSFHLSCMLDETEYYLRFLAPSSCYINLETRLRPARDHVFEVEVQFWPPN